MEPTKDLVSIGLSALAPLPFNVRGHSGGQIEEAAILIDSQGLLHNLVVTQQVVGKGGACKLKSAMAASECRRRAPLLLQPRGRLSLCCGHSVRTRPCEASAYALETAANDPETGRAWHAMQQAKEAWRARLPELTGEWFRRLIDLSQADVIDLLAHCSAFAVNALAGTWASASAKASAATLGPDMADRWQLTPEGYLDHLSRAQILNEPQEAGLTSPLAESRR